MKIPGRGGLRGEGGETEGPGGFLRGIRGGGLINFSSGPKFPPRFSLERILKGNSASECIIFCGDATAGRFGVKMTPKKTWELISSGLMSNYPTISFLNSLGSHVGHNSMSY